jgi:hypothetical protein
LLRSSCFHRPGHRLSASSSVRLLLLGGTEAASKRPVPSLKRLLGCRTIRNLRWLETRGEISRALSITYLGQRGRVAKKSFVDPRCADAAVETLDDRLPSVSG